MQRARRPAGRQHRHAVSIAAEAMADRKAFPAAPRSGAATTRLQRWAAGDLRSLNAQIEFLLRQRIEESRAASSGERASVKTRTAPKESRGRPRIRSRRAERFHVPPELHGGIPRDVRLTAAGAITTGGDEARPRPR